MNIKDNQRSRLTRLLMKQAYLSLMRQKPSGKITVKEICEAAELNRSTFYLHYAEPNDILIELEDEAIAEIARFLSNIGATDENTPDGKAYLAAFLHYVRKKDDLFRTFLAENNDQHFRNKLQNYAVSTMDCWFRMDIPQEYKSSVYIYLISGSLELLTVWVKSGYEMKEKTVSDMLYAMCEGTLNSIINGFGQKQRYLS